MENTANENITNNVSHKEGSFLKSLLKGVLIFTLLFVAASKVVEFLKNKTFTKFNAAHCVKKFICVFNRKKFTDFDCDEKLDGICVYSFFGISTVDLSDVKFNEDAFISVRSYFSKVRIIVPEDFNVRVDGFSNKSKVKNFTVSYDETAPSLYVVHNSNFSKVKICN